MVYWIQSKVSGGSWNNEAWSFDYALALLYKIKAELRTKDQLPPLQWRIKNEINSQPE